MISNKALSTFFAAGILIVLAGCGYPSLPLATPQASIEYFAPLEAAVDFIDGEVDIPEGRVLLLEVHHTEDYYEYSCEPVVYEECAPTHVFEDGMLFGYISGVRGPLEEVHLLLRHMAPGSCDWLNAVDSFDLPHEVLENDCPPLPPITLRAVDGDSVVVDTNGKQMWLRPGQYLERTIDYTGLLRGPGSCTCSNSDRLANRGFLRDDQIDLEKCGKGIDLTRDWDFSCR